MSAVTTTDTPRPGFLHNVVWGWLGVGVNLAIGILLIPIIMRKLGVERYGLWVLIFSVVDYMRVLDFGFRAAVINGVARFRERQDWEGVNRTVVTALTYFFAVAATCVLAAWIVRYPLAEALVLDDAGPGAALADAMRREASTLIVLVALAVSVRLVSSPLTATLEGLVRFDIVNRAYIGALLFRSVTSLSLLLLGFGLVEMAWVVLVAQIGEAVYTWSRVRKLVPHFHVARHHFDSQVFRGLFGYGRYSAVISAANLVSINAPATVLGSVRTAAEVGFFSLPYRLLMYSAEALAKVSDVTASVTAGLDERGDRQRVWNLAVLTNRTCFALYMPVAIFLSIYGAPLLRLMVTEEVARQSGGLFPILVIGFLFAIAGQYNAGAVLIGQGKHSVYAYGALVEALATIGLLLVVVPTSGIQGAAWVVSLAILGGRGVFLAVMLCVKNGFSLPQYLGAVYGPGLGAAIPIVVFAVWLERAVLPGATWFELIAAGVLIAGTYFSLAFFLVLRPDHRHAVLSRIGLAR